MKTRIKKTVFGDGRIVFEPQIKSFKDTLGFWSTLCNVSPGYYAVSVKIGRPNIEQAKTDIDNFLERRKNRSVVSETFIDYSGATQ